MRRLVCRVVGHRRSASRARLTGSGWKSVCKRCRSRLVRIAPSTWRVTVKKQPANCDGYIIFVPTREPIALARPRLSDTGPAEAGATDQNTSSGIAMTVSAPASTFRRCEEDSGSSRCA